MTRSARLKSLAKVNLDLRVLHKRADGFHELRTVFQTVSLADTIEIEYQAARRTTLHLDDPLAIPNNLVLRAASAVLDALKIHAHIRFRLKKRIPMGGGFGGGSSNAAAILLALPVLAGRRLTLEELTNVGAGLGSDVPFFLLGGTATAFGRGTEVYRLPEVKSDPVLLIAPGIHVATAAAYQALARPLEGLTSPDLSRKINGFQLFVRILGDLRSAAVASAVSANDFESVVFAQYPQLKVMWGRLRKNADGARMTGSGSALFAVFGSADERNVTRKILEGDRVFGGCRVMPASVVPGRAYRRLWRRQLAEHLAPAEAPLEPDLLWPPQSRYSK